MIDNWNADRVRMAEFIDLAKKYTDFSELTTPMLNEFIEKIVVHEGRGRGKQRRQQEEQAEKEERSKALAQARYEKREQERREFTARKQAGLLTPEEQAEEERRLERNRAYQKKQRNKKKASQPEKPRKRSLEELAKLEGPEPTSPRRKQSGLPLTSRERQRR